ncbi:hypothetical protein [Iamia sp.]|uniref:hypothetical protein n=1 Tax=Iamia sp. TaxID=2722710 RepID=UPI002BC5DD2A|nr:hypothetical protein [Iamia sp.]HXH58805.1 hypothetical protein [Iamia sp.]
MAGDDSVTFRLDGEVTIGLLSDALRRFSKVLDELSRVRDAHVAWVLSGLEYGSAMTTARAIPLDKESAAAVSDIVEDYLGAARQVARGNLDPDRPILRLVGDLAAVADDEHPLVLETAEDDVIFTGQSAPPAPPSAAPEMTRSLGAIRGRIETLSHRGGLRFTLYDLTNDRPVSCYLRSEDEAMMRGAWGRIADVTGTITRDAATGRPRAIRRVSRVDLIAEGDSLGYKQARGAIRLDGPAEQVIRRVRNAS